LKKEGLEKTENSSGGLFVSGAIQESNSEVVGALRGRPSAEGSHPKKRCENPVVLKKLKKKKTNLSKVFDKNKSNYYGKEGRQKTTYTEKDWSEEGEKDRRWGHKGN